MCEGLIGRVQKRGDGGWEGSTKSWREQIHTVKKKTLIVKPLKDKGKGKVSAGIFAVAAGTQQERLAEQTDWGLLSYWIRVTCGSYPTLAGISNRLSVIYVGSPDKLSQIPDPWLFHTKRLIYLQILFILQRSRSSPPCCVQKQFMETPAKNLIIRNDDSKIKMSPLGTL